MTNKKLIGTVCAVLVGLAITGAWNGAWSTYQDTRDNTTRSKANASEIKGMKTQVNEIHWLLIKSKNVKIPSKK